LNASLPTPKVVLNAPCCIDKALLENNLALDLGLLLLNMDGISYKDGGGFIAYSLSKKGSGLSTPKVVPLLKCIFLLKLLDKSYWKPFVTNLLSSMRLLLVNENYYFDLLVFSWSLAMEMQSDKRIDIFDAS